MRFYTIIFTLIISLLNIHIYAQASEIYHVIHVKGSIQNASGKAIKVGDKIEAQEKVKFSNKDALAVIISTKKGRMVLTPPKNAAKREGELVFLAKNVILPLKTNAKLSTRGNIAEGVIDFNNYFGKDSFAIIGNRLEIPVATALYPSNNGEQYFVYAYKLNNQLIQKKIAYKDDKIVLDKEMLYTVDGKFVEPESIQKVNFYFFNEKTNYAKKLASFKPIFIEETTLKDELTALKNIFESYSVEKLHDEFYKFIEDVYGHTDKEVFDIWTKETISLP